MTNFLTPRYDGILLLIIFFFIALFSAEHCYIAHYTYGGKKGRTSSEVPLLQNRCIRTAIFLASRCLRQHASGVPDCYCFFFPFDLDFFSCFHFRHKLASRDACLFDVIFRQFNTSKGGQAAF